MKPLWWGEVVSGRKSVVLPLWLEISLGNLIQKGTKKKICISVPLGSFIVLIKALKCFLKSSSEIRVKERELLLWLKKICQRGQQLSPQWQNTKIHESAKPEPEQLQARAALPRPAQPAQIPFDIPLPTALAAQPPAARSHLPEAGLPGCCAVTQQQRCPGWWSGKLCYKHGSCAVWTARRPGAPATSLACALPSTILYFGRVKTPEKAGAIPSRDE